MEKNFLMFCLLYSLVKNIMHVDIKFLEAANLSSKPDRRVTFILELTFRTLPQLNLPIFQQHMPNKASIELNI